MNPLLLKILAGVATGALLAFPVRLLAAFLLRQRGLDGQMPQAHFWILLVSLAAVGGVIGWRAGFTLRGAYLLLLLCAAACAFVIDARYRILPNELTLAILLLAAGFGLAVGDKSNLAAIWRPNRIKVICRVLAEIGLIGAIWIHRVNLAVAIPVAVECDVAGQDGQLSWSCCGGWLCGGRLYRSWLHFDNFRGWGRQAWLKGLCGCGSWRCGTTCE